MLIRLMLALAFGSAGALAQTGCLGQLQPLKPLTPLGCMDTVAACQCADNGNCRWVYVCSTEPERRRQRNEEYWRIPLGVNNPPVAQDAIQGASDALALRIQMERLRQLQMQTEINRRNLERLHNESQGSVPDQPEGYIPQKAAPGHVPTLEEQAKASRDAFNGYVWRGLTRPVKKNFTDNPKAVDRFYSKPQNLAVAIEDAVEIVKAK